MFESTCSPPFQTIVSYLQPNDLLECAKTCQSWKALEENNVCWRRHLPDQLKGNTTAKCKELWLEKVIPLQLIPKKFNIFLESCETNKRHSFVIRSTKNEILFDLTLVIASSDSWLISLDAQADECNIRHEYWVPHSSIQHERKKYKTLLRDQTRPIPFTLLQILHQDLLHLRESTLEQIAERLEALSKENSLAYRKITNLFHSKLEIQLCESR